MHNQTVGYAYDFTDQWLDKQTPKKNKVYRKTDQTQSFEGKAQS